MIGTMSRAKATMLTRGAQASLLIAAGASAFLLTRAEPVIDTPSVAVIPGPSKGGGTPTEPAKPVGPREASIDARAVGSRLGSIANVPRPPEPPPPTEAPTDPAEEPEPESASDEAITYVGPVRLGAKMSAIISVGGKQRLGMPGRGISYTVEERTESATLVSVSEDHIVVSQNGKERRIAKAAGNGEVVSYLGDRPSRSPVAVRPGGVSVSRAAMGGASAPPGAFTPSGTDLQSRQAARMRAAQQINDKIRSIQESGEPVPPELWEQFKLMQSGMDEEEAKKYEKQ
ncbi:MAG: hypothetical protein HRU70_03675 [Phycisphaeraceae bacterium]|nr:MAG: hypothetical protein HRU70_03675 [Phycisphaeraceae bacterium]